MNIFTKYVKRIKSEEPSPVPSQQPSIDNDQSCQTDTPTECDNLPSVHIVTMNGRPVFYTKSRSDAIQEIQKILNIIEYSNSHDDLLIEESDFLDEFKVHKRLDFILFNMNCEILSLKIHEIEPIRPYV